MSNLTKEEEKTIKKLAYKANCKIAVDKLKKMREELDKFSKMAGVDNRTSEWAFMLFTKLIEHFIKEIKKLN